jgi:hypothetical protein
MGYQGKPRLDVSDRRGPEALKGRSASGGQRRRDVKLVIETVDSTATVCPTRYGRGSRRRGSDETF